MNLYLVTCRGMNGQNQDGIAYVVAPDPTTAYRVLRHYLDKEDLGFASDRALASVELLAEDGEVTECGRRLFMPPLQDTDEDYGKGCYPK